MSSIAVLRPLLVSFILTLLHQDNPIQKMSMEINYQISLPALVPPSYQRLYPAILCNGMFLYEVLVHPNFCILPQVQISSVHLYLEVHQIVQFHLLMQMHVHSLTMQFETPLLYQVS